MSTLGLAVMGGVAAAGLVKEGASKALDGIREWLTDAEGKERRRVEQWAAVSLAFRRTLDGQPGGGAQAGWHLGEQLGREEMQDPPRRLSIWMRTAGPAAASAAGAAPPAGAATRTSMGQNDLRGHVEPLLQRMWHYRSVLKARERSPLHLVVLEMREWLLKLTHMQMDERCVASIGARARYLGEIEDARAFQDDEKEKDDENARRKREREVLRVMREDLRQMQKRVSGLIGAQDVRTNFLQLVAGLRITVTKCVEFLYFVLLDETENFPTYFDMLELREATTAAERRAAGLKGKPSNLFARSGFVDTAYGLALRALVRTEVMHRVLPSRVDVAGHGGDDSDGAFSDEDDPASRTRSGSSGGGGGGDGTVVTRTADGCAVLVPPADDPEGAPRLLLANRREALRLTTESAASWAPAAAPLVLWVESAGGLPSADLGGLSDPYVSARWLGDKDAAARTRHVNKTLSPVWDATLELEWRDGGRLVLDVHDWDRVGGHSLLGRAVVDVPQGARPGSAALLGLQRLHCLPLFKRPAAEFDASGAVPGQPQAGELRVVLVPPGAAGTGSGDAALEAALGAVDTDALVADMAASMEGSDRMRPSVRAKIRARVRELENPFRSLDGALAVPPEAYAADARLLERLQDRRLRQQEPNCAVVEGANGFVPRTFCSAHAYFVHWQTGSPGVLPEVCPVKGRDATLAMEREYLRPLLRLVAHTFDLACFVAVLEQAALVAGLGGDILMLHSANEHAVRMLKDGMTVMQRVHKGMTRLVARCDKLKQDSNRVRRWREDALEKARRVLVDHLSPQLHDGHDSAMSRLVRVSKKFTASQAQQSAMLLEGQRHLNAFNNLAEGFCQRLEYLDGDGVGSDGRGQSLDRASSDEVRDFADAARASQVSSIGALAASARRQLSAADAAAMAAAEAAMAEGDAEGAGDGAGPGAEGAAAGTAGAGVDDTGAAAAAAPDDDDDDVESLETGSVVYWENQRWTPVNKWQSTVRAPPGLKFPPFTDQGGVQPFREAAALQAGWVWRPGSEWQVDYAAGDAEGWLYAFNYPTSALAMGGYERKKKFNSYVRRRRHRRAVVRLRTHAERVERPAGGAAAPAARSVYGAERHLAVLEARALPDDAGGEFVLVTEKVAQFLRVRGQWRFPAEDLLRSLDGAAPRRGRLALTVERGEAREVVTVTANVERAKDEIDLFAFSDGDRVRGAPRPHEPLGAPLRVVQATWGLGHRSGDVTEEMQHLVDVHGAARLELCPRRQFDIAAAPSGVPCYFFVHYELCGRRLIVSREVSGPVTINFFEPAA